MASGDTNILRKCKMCIMLVGSDFTSYDAREGVRISEASPSSFSLMCLYRGMENLIENCQVRKAGIECLLGLIVFYSLT